jgi:uroporphyrinogen-III decarboxylase
MKSREIIQRVVSFAGPERIGMTFDRGRMNDIAGAGPTPPPGWSDRKRVEGNMEVWYDEWGNQWHRIIGLSAGGEIREPVLKDWKDLDTLKLPDYDNPARYENARKAFAAHADKYHLGSLPGFPFAIMRYMRKMEVFLADVLLHRAEVEELQRRVVALLKGVVRNMAKAGADAVFFCEDWGTQERLLISPKLWRDLFKPGFAALVGEAKANGIGVWMHSCGCVYDIIGDLAGVGMQVLQFDQPTLAGIERLGREFGGQVTFWCPVDIQRTLQTGDRERIRAEARLLVERLGGHRGGFIAKNYGDLHGIGVEPEWDDWAYQVFAAAARRSSSG